VAGQPIAPVIPPDAGQGRGTPRRHGSSRPLPLASPPAVPLDAVYGVSRIDASGRITGQLITEVLGWRAGDRLTLTAGAGVVVARRDPGGMVAVLARRAVAIPAALRRRCGLRPGDPVLRAALPGQDTLAAYTFTVVDHALRPQAALLQREGARP
jgi:bifunctional DNA-binding transcriptional regulator/antitoxin component of YhaV-PrlF toxin-antitoxin module